MKKILAMFLAVIMTAAVIFGAAGCARDPDDKGATLIMYLSANPFNWNLDPGKLMYAADAIKYISLAFEGMTVMDEKGKLTKGMAKEWKITEDEEKGLYQIVFTIKETRWIDGQPVTANDFISAWKRILEPEFNCPAAALLFPIKNARAVKAGDMTVDDLGIYSDDIKILRVEFERKINYDKFLENLASPYLVPLRADAFDTNPVIWARAGGDREEAGSISMTMLSNGPFTVKQMEYEKLPTVYERSTFYLKKDEEDIFKYVTPYKLQIECSRDLAAVTEAYENTEDGDHIFYLGDVPKDKFDALKSQAVIKNLTSAYTYFFNADNPLFKDARVRKALSVALDRDKIAEIVGRGVKPATGIVPHGIIDAKSDKIYRDVRDGVISASANVQEAKNLLSSAGVSRGSFRLHVRYEKGVLESELAVAEYAKGVWESLGFSVEIVKINSKAPYDDIILNKNSDGERQYDVIGYDMLAPGVDAFAVLAPFAELFSGSAQEFMKDVGKYKSEPYITGFRDAEYDKLIEEIYLMDADKDFKARTDKLFEAEKVLAELAPVAPLYFNVNINITKEITGLTYSKYGTTIFTKANLKNYNKYSTEEVTTESAG